MDFFTFISQVVSLQFKQPLFFPRFYKVHLIVITRYVSYTPILVARQLGGIQHVSRTTKLSWFSMLFKDHSVLKVIMENIKQDWKLVVLIKKRKESDGLRDPITIEKYPKWRNLSFIIVHMNLEFESGTLQAIELDKRKKINNKKELREQLEKLQVELSTSKTLRISLEEQLLTKEKLRKFVEQQLMGKDKKVVFLEKQLKEEKVVRNQSKKKRGELGASWMQTKIVFLTLKVCFNDCKERTDISSRVPAELESRIEQYE